MNKGDERHQRATHSGRRYRWRPTVVERKLFVWIGGLIAAALGFVSGVAQFVGPYAHSGLQALVISVAIVATGGLAVAIAILLWKRGRSRVALPWAALVLGAVALLAAGAVGGGALRSSISGSSSSGAAQQTTSASSPDSAPLAVPTSSVSTSEIPIVTPQGSIDYPPNHALVDQKIDARGAISGLPRGHKIILLLLYGTCYFPQPTTPTGPNSWESIDVPIGGDEASGMDFTLNLADIGPRGIIELDKYNKAEKNRGSAVGICSRQELAEAYEVRLPFLASVQITRKK
jgi:hypothetical protein